MTKRCFIRPFGIMVGSLALAGAAAAQDFDISGEISLFGQDVTTSATDLVPDPLGSGYQSRTSGGSAVLQTRFDAGDLSLRGQFRLEFSEGQTSATVDEAYGEYAVASGQGFVFAGRRIFSYGQSYGLNPTDIFADPLRENRIFPSAKARNDVQGVDMLGAEWLFNSGASIAAMYAPEFDPRGDGVTQEFGMLRYAGTGAGGALDYAISVFNGTRAGVGISATYGLGEASVLYVDATVRQGRDKQTVTGVLGDQLSVAAADADKIVPFLTLGFGHTFGSGVTMNAELTHDAGGYSDAEWTQVASALDALTPVRSATAGQSLGQLNGTLNHFTLRQNYGFLRVAQDGVLGSAFNAEFTVLHGFDDQSGSAGLRIERALGDNLTAGIAVSRKYGTTNSEFMLRPETGAVSLYTTLRF